MDGDHKVQDSGNPGRILEAPYVPITLSVPNALPYPGDVPVTIQLDRPVETGDSFTVAIRSNPPGVLGTIQNRTFTPGQQHIDLVIPAAQPGLEIRVEAKDYSNGQGTWYQSDLFDLFQA